MSEIGGIEGVVYRQRNTDSDNNRPERLLVALMNGDEDLRPWFNIQIKLLLLRCSDILGKRGHFHKYAELYFVLRGEVTFDLKDPNTGSEHRYTVGNGGVILIPPFIAHRAYGNRRLIMLAVTQQPYKPGDDIEEHFDPIGLKPYDLV